MKLLIAGRTGAGKDTLQDILKNGYGWKPLLSYTTRVRRPGEKDTHRFISKAEADAIPKSEKVTYAYFQNETQGLSEYFSTRKQVQESDCYIVDPDAIRILTKKYARRRVFDCLSLHGYYRAAKKRSAFTGRRRRNSSRNIRAAF